MEGWHNMNHNSEKTHGIRNVRSVAVQAVPIVILAVIVVFFEIISDGKLLTSRNMKAIFNNMFSIAIGAAGVSFLMAQGNLDFSLGGIAGLSAAVSGIVAVQSPILSVFAGILVGCACGWLNGFIHAKLHVASIITTLSTAYIFRGIQCTLLDTRAVGLPASMMWLENRNLKLVIMIVILAICGVVYTNFRFGKQCKAIGSRAEAAHQSGIFVDRIRIAAFVVAGGFAGIVGFFFLVRAASVSANTGSGFEFNVLLAMLLGGVSISGGTSTRYRGVIIGSLIMAVLSNGMTLWNLDVTTQQLIRGLIFLFAVTSSFDRKNLAVIK